MHAVLALVLFAIGFFARISATPLDDYVWKHDDNYKWVEMVSLSILLCWSLVVLIVHLLLFYRVISTPSRVRSSTEDTLPTPST
jgi:hypothetical protein